MTEPTTTGSAAHILAAGDGEVAARLGGITDRFMIDGKATGGRFALVRHLFAPRALAAPMHRHRDEDEYTYVLEGRIGAILGGEVSVAGPGDLIFKPRNQWHTSWNAGDTPAAVLELISPAGLEELFREFGRLTSTPDPPGAGLDGRAVRLRPRLRRHLPLGRASSTPVLKEGGSSCVM